MGREINIDRIRDLDKQIEEGAGDMVELKRTRNSLLNISTIVPPEILGSIFRWNLTSETGFPPTNGYPEGTYNFLLVCHHWFEVASHTPELWGFWGCTLKEWSQWYKRSGTTPVDLMLSAYYPDSPEVLNEPLQDILRDRAACNLVRSLHLLVEERPLVTSILSTLTPDDEDVQCSGIESIVLRCVDVSEFFARHRFPKLWHLNLSTGVTISSWEDIGLHTTALTNLSLTIEDISHVLTTPQLLSILASNPRLQRLTLSGNMIPRDREDGSTVPVPLRHLKKLSLNGEFHPVFQLLRWLDHPETIYEMNLYVSRCTVEDISRTLGPYVRDYTRRDERFRDELAIHAISARDSVLIQASTISGVAEPIRKVGFAKFTATLQGNLHRSEVDKLSIDLVAHTPREHVVYFHGNMGTDAVRKTVAAMPNLQELHLIDPVLVGGFLQPDWSGPLANKKLLPSLRCLCLENPVLSGEDWNPVISYLTHQTSGGQGISLTISGPGQHICENWVWKMRPLVEELVIDMDGRCRWGHCS